MAGCDHCPPQAKIAETIGIANSMQDEIEFVMGDAEEYDRKEIIGDELLPFEFLSDNIQFSAFKRSYDGNGYILR